MLSENPHGNLTGEQVKFSESIYSAGNDLLNLINDILDISKVEAGKLEVLPENASVVRVVEGLRGMFEPLAGDKGLTLTVEVQPGTPALLYTDSQRLEQILKNLLVLGNTDTRIPHGKRNPFTGYLRNGEADLAFFGEFDRVGQQVFENLLQPLAVGVDHRRRARLQLHVKVQGLFAALVHARRINVDGLNIAFGLDAQHVVAGGLRLARGDLRGGSHQVD